MSRLTSKTGCSRCKLRRKKCDEKRPTCSACARWPQWRDSCSYVTPLHVPHSSSLIASKALAGPSKALSIHSPGGIRQQDKEMEARILQITPELLGHLFSPTSARPVRDLQIMWQLMMSNQILRNACVACFSRFLEDSTALTTLSQEAYGRCLQALRSKILKINLDEETAISVVISMVFLGKLESFAPRSNADALEHWGPLIPLLASNQLEKLWQSRIFPSNERSVIFEGLLYHVGTHGIFSRSTERVWKLWKAHNMYQRLCAHNPEGPNRIRRSPALSGQYQLYDLAFNVIYLLRSQTNSHFPLKKIDELEAMIRQHDARLDRDFAAISATSNRVKIKEECRLYHFWCNSLLICVTALRDPSPSRRLKMKHLADSGMQMFLDTPVYGAVEHLSQHIGHFILTAIWPIQIQGCAVYDTKQFQTFMDHYAWLEPFLDPGHQIRAQCLFDQVRACLEKAKTKGQGSNSVQPNDPAFPTGLTLLRSPVLISEPKQKTIKS